MAGDAPCFCFVVTSLYGAGNPLDFDPMYVGAVATHVSHDGCLIGAKFIVAFKPFFGVHLRFLGISRIY